MTAFDFNRALSVFVACGGMAVPVFAQWIPDYQVYAIQRVGLYGPAHTGTVGVQSSTVSFFQAPGYAAGISSRYTVAGADNGQNAWVWNGVTTQLAGLTTGAHTGTAGRQFSEAQFLGPNGWAAGRSRRYSGVDTDNGYDAWAWNGMTNIQLGFTGPGYTGSGGYQFSSLRFQSSDGSVLGTTYRVVGATTYRGQDAWIWNGTTTVQLGLTGPGYTGSAGFQISVPLLRTNSGQVMGYSERYLGVQTAGGRDSWVWNGTTTTQVGLTDGVHTGSGGYRSTDARFQNEAGQVSGYSTRYSGVDTYNGSTAWVWNGSTTQQIGLSGEVYIGPGDRRNSYPVYQNQAGQVAGISERFGSGPFTTQDAWIWNGLGTQQIGLTGGAYVGSTGAQFSSIQFQNELGHVAGSTLRYLGETTDNGADVWTWNGASTQPVGLMGGVYTGSSGYQRSVPQFQNAQGALAGVSRRYIGVNTQIGQDAWVWTGATTVPVGLTGAAYSGSAGFRFSQPEFLNDQGVAAGITRRIVSVNTSNGQDTWYFDPVTQLSSPVIGSIRASDGFAFSDPTILTDGGFLLGNYLHFPEGTGSGEQRAFIYRPDLGLTDLGNLVNGGLTAGGWASLQNPQFSDALRTILGYGYVNGQTGGQSVFAMFVPAPGAALLLGLAGALRFRRGRGCMKD